ncbi:recombination mediator RecR [uncultured Roseibium sp.]|uniref:recombination mediator RecR n=1 Tax=uncultured Roseibium sp. TaxID=1936171 RepID=UPI0026172FFB|nr:recombination mediator RecR [uncultured Roseibium sp.]
MAQKSVAGPEIERLIQLLAKLPGLGPRSARRAALHLIKKKDQLLVPLAEAMGVAVTEIGICSTCGTVDTSDPCTICSDPRREQDVLVVVEDVADLWALERAGAVNARYHVLGGTLSPLDGIGPEDLNLGSLIDRCGADGFTEIILAINATVEGQTTAHYIMDQLSHLDVRVTRLAHGVPVGGELDYLDEGTLNQALKARTRFD